jgi:Transposase DNA-binding/Transposase Tn5 dimerisation domain
MATAIAENPSASLPESMCNWADTLAAYRFLDNEAVTHEQIMTPHWRTTRQEAMQRSRVLLAADTTDINLSSHETAEGLGPIGRGNKAQGFFVHTVLAMDADSQQLLGCMYQEPFVRQPAPKGETKAQRKKRVRESQVWERSIQAIGAVPALQKWIYVGDRGSDIYTFWQTCEQLGYDFVVRVAQDRRVLLDEIPEAEDAEVLRLKTLARALPAQGGRVLHVPAQRQRPARDAFVQISWQEVRIQPPANGAVLSKTEVKAWVVHVWEPEPPQGVEPLEWILLTTVPIACEQDAWERVKWYKWRWLLEDFHKVLKTGCGIEVRRKQTVGAMWNLLGILTPMAMRLLWLRQTAQLAPDTPATAVVSQEVIDVVTHLDKRPKVILTANDLWRTIASFGGYFNRKSDGPPGWQTLWKGWLYIQTVLQGVHLATRFPPP